MGREAQVLSTQRVHDSESGHGIDVKIDPGGASNATAPHYACPGDDSPPLTGDFAALEDSTSSTGGEFATGYADVRNAGIALPGEKRIYARNAAGAVVASLWLKGDGTIVGQNGGGTMQLSPTGVLSVSGSSDAAALASVVDAILSAVSSSVPAPASGPDAGEPGLLSIKAALASYLTSASAKLKVGG